MMSVASCIPFPFPILGDALLTMLVCTTRWLSLHLYMLAYMSMHDFLLIVCHPYFNTMKLWTSDPNLHLSLADTTFCLFACLFSRSFVHLACPISCHILCLPCLSCLFVLCLFICSLRLFLPLLVCWFSCLCLCMYAHGVRKHGAGRVSWAQAKGARM